MPGAKLPRLDPRPANTLVSIKRLESSIEPRLMPEKRVPKSFDLWFRAAFYGEMQLRKLA
jgi:hypothetical protein